MRSREEKFIFQAGRKTFDVIKGPREVHYEFNLLERYRGRVHEIFLSYRELLWVCDWMGKAHRIKGEFWKKGHERMREVCVAKMFNKAGTFISIKCGGLGRSREVCIPEVVVNCGWDLLGEKMRKFAHGFNTEKKQIPRSFEEAAAIPPWPDSEVRVRHGAEAIGVDFMVEEDTCRGTLNFLERCLVGRVGDLDCPTPLETLFNSGSTRGGRRSVE